MDDSLPSYEAAMRDANAYLRRRDLSSQDEIPLYFAWQRLYTAANANLSTDFVQETGAELRARQQSRLAPRRGLPPPLFTLFDKVNRSSSQASAFLRSGTSSDAAVEMMARRYRREAGKLRSSREKLVSSLDDVEKRMKKTKRRQKNPEQEVEELLEAFERPRTKGMTASTLNHEGKRTQKTNSRQNPAEHESEEYVDFDNAEMLESKVRVHVPTTKGGLDFTGGKDTFASELGVGDSAGKAEELRRSSFSGRNPTTMPSFSTVANVAAFAARVSDWRMPSQVDEVSPSSNHTQKRTASTRKSSLEGASELRGSTLVEGGEMDTTFESSGLEEGSSEEDGSGELNTTSVSPTNRRQTEYGVEDVEAKDKMEVGEVQRAAATDAEVEMRQVKSSGGAAVGPSSVKPPQFLASTIDASADASDFQQKLIQLSHAVGDMQVKIQGKQIEVSFKGSLDDEGRAGFEVVETPKETKQPSVIKKVLDTTGSRSTSGSHDPDRAEKEQDSTQHLAQPRYLAKGLHAPRKQSNVRFADAALSDGNDDVDEDHHFSDQQATFSEIALFQPRSASVVPVRPTEHSDQRGNNSSRDSAARRATPREDSLLDEDYREETKDEETLQGQRGSSQQQRNDDIVDERSEEEGDFQTASNHTELHNATRLSEEEYSLDERQDNHRSESVRPRSAEVRRHQQSVRDTPSDAQDVQTARKRNIQSGPANNRSSSSERGHIRDTVAPPEQVGEPSYDSDQLLEQRSHLKRDSQRASLRQARKDIIAPREQRPDSTKRESRASRSRRDVVSNAKLFSDESDERRSNGREFDNSDEALVSRERGSCRSSRRHPEQRQVNRNKSATSSSFRGQKFQGGSKAQDRGHERRRSRNQVEEVVDVDSHSDDDLSDGPDTPYKRHHEQRRYPSAREHSRGYHDTFEALERKSTKRPSTRSTSYQHETSYVKRRSHSPDVSNESDGLYRTDYDIGEDQNFDEIRDSHSSIVHHSRPHHSTRTDRQTQYSTHEASHRDRHYASAMDSPPRLSKSDIRINRDVKAKREPRSTGVARRPRKLPEDIVWPPGMEDECIARLGHDDHHPIAPPGLEHLVTKEQWEEYWTWLHWYSSWQMWYMKNGKKPTRKSDKEKRSDRRREEVDNSVDDKNNPRNANWWVDAGRSKHRCGSDRLSRLATRETDNN